MNYFCEGLSLSLSQPNILSVGFTTALSHPPLCCSDWLRDREEREREKGERVRQCSSLSTLLHTVKPKARDRGEKRECFHSTYFSQTGTTFNAEPTQPPPFFRSLFNQELLIFHCGLNHALLTLGVVVFSVCVGMF